MSPFLKRATPALLLLCTCLPNKTTAQHFFPAAAVPGICLGYIPGAGISLAAEVNYTPFMFSSGLGKTAAGMYASYTLFHSKGEIYKETWYNTRSFGAVLYSDDAFMFKAGLSRTVLPWGMDKRNKFKSRKRSLDVDLSYSPWKNGAYIGYRLYFPGEACFGLDINAVNMFYTAYRYNFDQAMFRKLKE